MLVAILALRPLSGATSFRIVDLLPATQALPLGTQVWLFLAFTLAFAVKLPLWPLHGWLPDFHEQNHPSGVADVAGTLYKVGGWGFFAFALPLFPAAAALLTPYLLALAAFTAVYAAVVATAQTNLKRLLAYASLSHMGIVGVGVFGLYLTGLGGAMYLLAAQMLSTGALFLISGMLYSRRNSFELSEYGGLAKSAPALAALTLFAMFASIGVPGLSNFPGEFMSLLGAFERSAWLGGFATLAVIAAGVYGVNMYQRLYQVDAKEDVREVGGARAGRPRSARPGHLVVRSVSATAARADWGTGRARLHLRRPGSAGSDPTRPTTRCTGSRGRRKWTLTGSSSRRPWCSSSRRRSGCSQA